MLCRSLFLLAFLPLAACMQKPVPAPVVFQTLDRNTLACRSPKSVDALHASGANFQREADNQMADGRCRMFQKGHRVTGRTGAGFIEPAGQKQYWIYHWG